LLEELLGYDPSTIDDKTRAEVSKILQSRSVLLTAQAEVAGLRARTWAGEVGLSEIIDLKAADLAKLREDYSKNLLSLLKRSVDVDGLLEMLPMFGMALLQKLNVPLPVLLESLGADLDAIKALVEIVKEAISDM
jgi:hypothetical protein